MFSARSVSLMPPVFAILINSRSRGIRVSVARNIPKSECFRLQQRSLEWFFSRMAAATRPAPDQAPGSLDATGLHQRAWCIAFARPTLDGPYHLLEPRSLGSESITGFGRQRGDHRLFDQTEPAEMVQPLRQRRRIATAGGAAQLVETGGASEQAPDDVKRPLRLQEIDRCVYWTRFFIFRHRQEFITAPPKRLSCTTRRKPRGEPGCVAIRRAGRDAAGRRPHFRPRSSKERREGGPGPDAQAMAGGAYSRPETAWRSSSSSASLAFMRALTSSLGCSPSMMAARPFAIFTGKE